MSLNNDANLNSLSLFHLNIAVIYLFVYVIRS